MYRVVFATRAKKDLRKYSRSGPFPLEKLGRALDTLAEGKTLLPSFEDHALKGSLAGQREFHLGYDVLVQYSRNNSLQVLIVGRIGTHSELFGR